jgi:hypothetical protein
MRTALKLLPALLLLAGCGAPEKAKEDAYLKAMVANLDEVTATAREYETAARIYVLNPMDPKNEALIKQVRERYQGKVKVVQATQPPAKFADLHQRYEQVLKRVEAAATTFEDATKARNLNMLGEAGREFAACQLQLNDVIAEYRKRT